MGTEYSPGQTAENTKVTTHEIKKKDMVVSTGLMARFIRANGKMDRCMVKDK